MEFLEKGVGIMGNHLYIEKKIDCCGCGACQAICPKHCITMVEDAEGFLYPNIDEDACVSCGACLRVCPMQGSGFVEATNNVVRSCACRNQDEAVRSQATSGGVFGALAEVVVSEGGAVIGSGFDSAWNVVHSVATDMSQVEDFYGSKYVQSDLVSNEIYKQVEMRLRNGQAVLFSGTPCQVAAVHSYLIKKNCPTDDLLLMDFVCRAVPSPGVWRIYLDEICEKFDSKIESIVFRNKTYGYHSGSMKIIFKDRSYYGSARVDSMHKAFFEDLISRPSCYSCPFRHARRVSDLTVFDCWKFEEHTGISDDDRGYTNVWIRSKKGLSIFEAAQPHLFSFETDYESVLQTDGVMAVRDIREPSCRDAFIEMVMTEGISKAVDVYCPVSACDRLVERAKKIVYRLGVLKFLKRMIG